MSIIEDLPPVCTPIRGSLLAGFYLIPSFSITHILTGAGILLVVLGLPLLIYAQQKQLINLTIILTLTSLLITLALLTTNTRADGVFLSKEGFYERLVVYEEEVEATPSGFFYKTKRRQVGYNSIQMSSCSTTPSTSNSINTLFRMPGASTGGWRWDVHDPTSVYTLKRRGVCRCC